MLKQSNWTFNDYQVYRDLDSTIITYYGKILTLEICNSIFTGNLIIEDVYIISDLCKQT